MGGFLMTGALKTTSISAPGFLGLNTQDSGASLESGYATKAYNCVIDKFGRLGARRGFTPITTDNDTLLDTDPIKSLFEYKDVDGNISYLSAGGGKLFVGLDTLAEQKVRNAADSADIALTTTNDNWQYANLAFGAGVTATGEVFLAQNGNPLLYYRKKTPPNYIFQRVGDVGSVPTGFLVGDFDPNCILSAFGRVWAASPSGSRTTVYYSQLLNGHEFAGVGSGVLDIASVVGNNDEIVAIADHNSFLVIFCKNNIVIYSDASTPSTMALQDVITGVGCIARDSVQKTGTDLVFLSKSGVRSLNRTIQEKSMPLRELSLNVRDDIISYVDGEDFNLIKSVYFERDAFYLLSFPSIKHVVCFDMRNQLPNGAARTTLWNNLSHTAYCKTEDRRVLLGNLGGIYKYEGYSDNGSSYRLEYFTTNTDLGLPSTLKFLKKAALTVIGSETQDFIVKYGFDYSYTFSSRVILNDLSSVVSEYAISEYGIGEWTGGLRINTFSVNLGGSGKIVQFGIESEVNGAPVSIQKADLYIKTGKLV